MVDWKKPSTDIILGLSLTKFTSLLCGIYIWEWAQSIHFDLYLLQRDQEKSRWTKWIYLLCRGVTLAACAAIVILGGNTHLGCKQYLQLLYGLAISSIFLASALIAIRAVTFWNFDKRAIALAVSGLIIQLGFSLEDLVQLDSVMDPTLNACALFHSAGRTAANSSAVLFCDLLLFSIMLVGLFRHRVAGGFGLWHFLWNQGLIWVALASLAEVPAVVFLFLNLDDVLNGMFLYPKLFVIVIAGTRMTRSLSSFARNYDPSNNMWDISLAPDRDSYPIPIRVRVHQMSEMTR